jgi:N-sulfoglucosamine sulfohydrolase
VFESSQLRNELKMSASALLSHPRHLVFGVLFSLASPDLPAAEPVSAKRLPNVILLLADDMNYDSPGFMGGRIPDLTPNLDRLAASGMVFSKCHVACAICGPSRAAMMTGLYPQSNGEMGHVHPIPAWWAKRHPDRKVSSLATWLREHGYFTARLDKDGSRFDTWDESLNSSRTGVGRDPSLYYAQTKRLIAKAKEQGKPFFMNINSRDPHEYWAGSPQETLPWAFKNLDPAAGGQAKKAKARSKLSEFKVYPSGKPYPEPSRTYSAAEIFLPPGLPDNTVLREQLKHYYNSVRRLDDTVGTVLQALDESGEAGNTLVMFWSDNGLGWPFCKFSDYPNGTRTPLVVRWPGHISVGKVDSEHVVTTVDIMPTVLEAAGLPQPPSLDGISLLGLLEGRMHQLPRTEVFDCFNFMGNPADKAILDETAYDPKLVERTDQYRPMRGLHSARHSYVWSAWADGQRELPLQMAARSLPMLELQKITSSPDDKNHTEHKERAQFYLKRVPEELYDTERDPGCLRNLIQDPAARELRDAFRAKMEALLKRTADHELENYQRFIRSRS